MAIPIGVFALSAATELNERITHAVQAYESIQLDEVLLALLSLCLCLAWFSWRNWRIASRELDRRIDAEHALEAKQNELRELMRRMTDALESERRFLAQELHDELGQTLNAIKIEAVGIRRQSRENQPRIHQSAAALIGLTDRVYAAVRQLLVRLRPVALDELGLAGAIEHAVAEWQTRTPDVRFRQDCRKLPQRLPDAIAIALYRVVQESITNSLRHAGAGEISISLRHEPAMQALWLHIRDNGRGVDLTRLRRGLGLLGMRERIESISGQMQVDSQPGAGFSLLATVPWPAGDALGAAA